MVLKVGDLIYLLAIEQKKIFPAQVIEEIRRKTISEEAVSYMICLPDKSGTCISLDDVKSKIFNNLKDAREYMINQAKTEIEKIIEGAAVLSHKFDIHVENIDVGNNGSGNNQDISVASGDVQVDLGNGLKAKVNFGELG